MAHQLDSATSEALLARVRFYRDLGLTEFYRRAVDPALLAQLATQPEEPQDLRAPSFPLVSAERVGYQESQTASAPEAYTQEEQAIPPRKHMPAPPAIATAVPAAERAGALQIIRDEIGECTRCALHTGRNKLVFGDGNPAARLMFVGEGPGADEDAQGLPFVGKAGQLLDAILEKGMGLKREQVYIANIVKCRPPNNRKPEPAEMASCMPYLTQQLALIKPRVIVALGATAVQGMIGSSEGITRLRGKWKLYKGTIPIMPTFHPAYLLRTPAAKREVWADLQEVMKHLGKAPAGKG